MCTFSVLGIPPEFFFPWLQNMVPKNLEGFPESFRSNYIVKLYGLKRGFSVELHKFRGFISQKLQHTWG